MDFVITDNIPLEVNINNITYKVYSTIITYKVYWYDKTRGTILPPEGGNSPHYSTGDEGSEIALRYSKTASLIYLCFAGTGFRPGGCPLGAAGCHSAVFADFAGPILLDAHGAAVFTLLAGIALNISLERLTLEC